MILLILINFLYGLIAKIFLLFTSPFHNFLSGLATDVYALHIPVTIYEVLGVVAYFLPMGTITILLHITIALVCIKIMKSLVKFIPIIGRFFS